MTQKVFLSVSLLGALALFGCTPSQPVKPVSVHNEMITVVIPKTQEIWDVSNASMDDSGVPTAAKMTTEGWNKAKAASEEVLASLNRLAAAKKVVVVTNGQKIMDEDVPSGARPADVQAKIDADLPGFHNHAKALADKFGAISKAIDAKDFDTFNTNALELDSACESCHKAFWLKPV